MSDEKKYTDPTTGLAWEIIKAGLKFWGLWSLAWLAIVSTIIFVVVHFVAKYW